MKKLVNQSKKLGVIALATMSLVAFSACGGGGSDIDRLEKLAIETLQKRSSVKVLSYDEAKKEYGLTNTECLATHNSELKTTTFYAFGNDESESERHQKRAYKIIISDKKDMAKIETVYLIDEFKAMKGSCFNK